ncbi:MAG: hypothetical protein HYU59_06370 [Magnetospirillum gryphiswaldense]|nr:hypothetical protein [Magnetospirillum gryphiswaldense]
MNAPRPKALVCFSGVASLWWLRLLRPGFRHCFVAVRQGPFWVVTDPLSHRTAVWIEAVDDLAGFYRRHQLVVVATRLVDPPKRPVPWRPYTCVEAVKRILGLRAPWVLTPWQLYRHLQIKENIP